MAISCRSTIGFDSTDAAGTVTTYTYPRGMNHLRQLESFETTLCMMAIAWSSGELLLLYVWPSARMP